MTLFAIRIEHPLDVAIQRPQHNDPRVHQRPTAFRSHDQRSVAACHSLEFCSALGSFMM
jgi:hypothetical protein